MATKATERSLMRQRVNVSPVLLNHWQNMYLFDIRNVVHGSLMKPEDLGTTFEHQGRTFEIVGMGESRLIILRECREEGIFFWECTRHFVQMKLERYNQQFIHVEGTKKSQLVPMSYDNNQLFLAPLKTRRKAKPIGEIEVLEEVEDEFENIDDYEVEDENANSSFDF